MYRFLGVHPEGVGIDDPLFSTAPQTINEHGLPSINEPPVYPPEMVFASSLVKIAPLTLFKTSFFIFLNKLKFSTYSLAFRLPLFGC